MNDASNFLRNRHLMSRDDSALLVVDAQDKLLNLIPGGDQIAWNIGRIASVAKILGIPVLATEQYPEKLGPTASRILDHVDADITAKLSFSCSGCPGFVEQMKMLDVHKVLVVGIETHVCIMQTCFDLMTAGYEVYTAVNAVGARFQVDHETAIRRMEANGVVLSTAETAIFEWCEIASGPQFKEISQIVRQSPPAE
ncbi:isochorismatase family protein [Planctomycetota bacterium]